MTVISSIDPEVCGCDSQDILAGLLSFDDAVGRMMSLEIFPAGVRNAVA